MMMENVAEALWSDVEIEATDLYHAAWDEAREVLITRYWSGEEAPPARHASARLIWSREALAVRFVCPQEEPLVISDEPQNESKTIGLWDRDVCEIFVAPDAERVEDYFEFEAAPTGEWIDLRIRWQPDARETDWEFKSGMTAAGRIEKGRVLVAMRVPWTAFGREGPRAGERWRANLFRCVGQDPTRGYLAWQPTRLPLPNFHLPAVFGWLHFAK